MTARERSLAASVTLTAIVAVVLCDRVGVGGMMGLAILIGGGCALAERWWTGGWR
jgi:hypothetical protein